MMGSQDDRQDSFLYNFRLEDHVPQDHLLRRIDEVLDLNGGPARASRTVL